jgi:hypothetical protein
MVKVDIFSPSSCCPVLTIEFLNTTSQVKEHLPFDLPMGNYTDLFPKVQWLFIPGINLLWP